MKTARGPYKYEDRGNFKDLFTKNMKVTFVMSRMFPENTNYKIINIASCLVYKFCFMDSKEEDIGAVLFRDAFKRAMCILKGQIVRFVIFPRFHSFSAINKNCGSY